MALRIFVPLFRRTNSDPRWGHPTRAGDVYQGTTSVGPIRASKDTHPCCRRPSRSRKAERQRINYPAAKAEILLALGGTTPQPAGR